jgi:protein phosphatase
MERKDRQDFSGQGMDLRLGEREIDEAIGERPLEYVIPDFCLVVLSGAPGAGKSWFARKWFRPTEIISSDWARGLVSDDERDQTVTGDAFDIVRVIAEKRLKNRRIAVIDATNVDKSQRRVWIDIAHRWNAVAVAIVFDPSLEACLEGNASRPNRKVDPAVLARMVEELRSELPSLETEGFSIVIPLRSRAEIGGAEIQRAP